ncbi:MAG: flippase-like domain-containing protein [Actinomycetota bacterium]|nr:flippase-like domain-containing protein [Actinomycetota bacterium]
MTSPPVEGEVRSESSSIGADVSGVDHLPPGERYFRHPGDVVRTVLWGAATLALIAFIELATGTSAGLAADLGRVATAPHRTVRELLLGLIQVTSVSVPIVVLVALAVRQRWRRMGMVVLGAAAAAAAMALIGALTDLGGTVTDALTDEPLPISTGFPSIEYLAGAVAAATVGKPWLAAAWRSAVDMALVALATTIAVAGTAGVPDLLLACAVGALAGSLVLVALGAPNRRPSPAAVREALAQAGITVTNVRLQAAVEGRAQLYRTQTRQGDACFLKVYAQDSRDAEFLYRSYRKLTLREPSDNWPASSLQREVEHEALMLMTARRAGVSCPDVNGVASLADGSVALVMNDAGYRRLDALDPDEINQDLLDAVWQQISRLHGAGLAHRALRAANILVTEERPVIIDMGFGEMSASLRMRAIDRAELLASLATIAGSEPVVASAARSLDPGDLAATLPFLQPLALSAATRKQVSKSLLKDIRTAIQAVTGQEPVALERLVRVKPRSVIMIATLAGAFYLLLPQLADVDDSFRAIGSANWWWLAGTVAMSGLTYVAGAIGIAAAVRQRLPFGAVVYAQLGSSFVNRVTPAKVGGLALNVRFMQKAGVKPAEAVTATGLNLLAGSVVHMTMLVVFFAWAGQGDSGGFKVPGSSKVLVGIVIVLAAAGAVVATRWGRRVIAVRVARFMRQSWSSIAALARSPGRLVALFGGSLGVTLTYTAALGCAVAAFDGGVTFAEIGAVYLGSSVVAAAAPTPGGLGAMEAALVAGFTGVGMESGVAVAAVLSYRLATFWLPVLPGWLSFQLLQRRDLI